MVEHEAEIYSRPPKTWFQTPKDRKKAAENAKKVAAGETGYGNQVESALSAKERRALEKKKAAKEKSLPR
jgi:ATP-dependent RNA helicase DDX27